MQQVPPSEVFRGKVMVVAPHMDDCVLACGGSIARLEDKGRVHMVYATDGKGSPEPELRWLDRVPANLGEIRCEEARNAMTRMGLPLSNVHFLGFPDGHLRRHSVRLKDALLRLFKETSSDRVVVPFRFDRHPDHLTVNHVVTQAIEEGTLQIELFEFFVYHRWRLLPGGDIRNHIAQGLLFSVDVSSVSKIKFEALSDFKSQTTRFYPWQSRPNLTAALLQQVSHDPEVFLRYEPETRGALVLRGPVYWILIAHKLEPFLKRLKDRGLAVARRLLGGLSFFGGT